jgi:hypothetical protein
MLKSPLFEFTGTVDPDATVPLDDFDRHGEHHGPGQ